jgi:2-isopropylmalate synthase
VDQIKVASVKGKYPTITNVAHVFQFRGDALGICCGLDMTGIHRSIDRMSWLNVNDSSSKSGLRAAASSGFESEDFSIPRNADRETVDGFVARLGYDLSEEDLAKVYDEFTRIASKKEVGSAELDTIIASSALQVPPTYVLKSYVINSGDIIAATANINLTKDGDAINGLSAGDGPIDAAFRAIEQILGHHYELDDFRIMSVTEGREAVGKALIKLRSEGRLFSGQGISTDIIGASIRAYVDAVNKIVYEENMI